MYQMNFGHLLRLFFVLALLWSSIIFSQGSPSSESVSHTFCQSAFDAVRLMQWTGGYGIMPYWPEPCICPKILNNPPEMPDTPAGSANGVPGASFSYSTNAVDPDGDQLKYTFDWGDETESSTPFINSGIAASASHTWSKAGTYEVKAMATDSKGALSQWSASLNVSINTPPIKPNAPSGPISGRPVTSYNYTVSSTDADEDRMRYIFDWGDGTESITGFLVSGAKAGANHSWKKAGTYQIKVLAIDERSASSFWSEAQNVTINSQPDKPSQPSGPGSVYAWAAYAYSSIASDPDGDKLEYTFDWGDGNASITNPNSSGVN
ncbi:MAG: hypothetical protein QG575_522, partial [Euryarchaeota archaeon]|nr:hypothetical protein [Euryarchaeota archaeon]